MDTQSPAVQKAMQRFSEAMAKRKLSGIVPGPDITCLDAAEMLIDAPGIVLDRQDRDELVRRVALLLSMQREALNEEFKDLREAARKAHFALQIGHNDYTDYGLAKMLKAGQI